MFGSRRRLGVFFGVAILAVSVKALHGEATEGSNARLIFTVAAQEKAPSADTALRALLAAQAADWNHGDIDAFMRGYWNSPETTLPGLPEFRAGGKPCWTTTTKIIRTAPRWDI